MVGSIGAMTKFSKADGKRLTFDRPLLRARLLNRPNRYVAYAELNGEEVRCHTPVGGRIGGLTLDGLPCLLSGPYEGRATDYTVEAIGLGQFEDPEFQWLAINQTAVNSYVREFFKQGELTDLAPGLTAEASSFLQPERKLGSARIDLHVAVPEERELWVEVKTPLIKLHAALPESIPVRTDYKSDSVGARMPKQMRELFKELRAGKRVVLLAAFGYANTLQSSDELKLKDNLDLDGLLTEGRGLGLESWQLEFALDEAGVSLKSCQQLS